ncbi:Gfo/Idh/MocA family protein [Salibacterium aidingense]|uniref:Gfo/Idh/MocA family protein n=1 Tax=Salibacterium aidingense TaxID=384933 RepID=UPI0004217D5B|nr:Gfo/Idh/MocA family oxidoreductase [Salibacterium aidingense]
MTILKTAVIGCGSIARNRHLPEYEANPSVEITAVCDLVKKRAERTAEPYGARWYTDYEELLKQENLDLVSICLPNYLHAPVSIQALDAGVHVLCEKPMAASSREAEDMITACKRNGKKLMIGHNQRFVPSHQKAYQLLRAGELGKVYSFRTTFGHGGPEGWSADGVNSWFFEKEKAIIGAMGDLGVHKADLLRWLLGEEFSEIAGFIENNAKKEITVDDNAVCILRSESGVIGTMAASWAYQSEEDNSTVIYGERGTMHLEEDPEHSLVIQYANGNKVKYELGRIASNEEGGQTGSYVIDHFVDCVLYDREPLIDGEEGKRSLEVILAAIDAENRSTLLKTE